MHSHDMPRRVKLNFFSSKSWDTFIPLDTKHSYREELICDVYLVALVTAIYDTDTKVVVISTHVVI